MENRNFFVNFSYNDIKKEYEIFLKNEKKKWTDVDKKKQEEELKAEDKKKKAGIEGIVAKLAKFHIQLKLNLNFEANLLDKRDYKELSFYIKGLDLSFVKPCGPLKIKSNILLRKLGLRLFLEKTKISEKKRAGIFSQEPSLNGNISDSIFSQSQ